MHRQQENPYRRSARSELVPCLSAACTLMVSSRRQSLSDTIHISFLILLQLRTKGMDTTADPLSACPQYTVPSMVRRFRIHLFAASLPAIHIPDSALAWNLRLRREGEEANSNATRIAERVGLPPFEPIINVRAVAAICQDRANTIPGLAPKLWRTDEDENGLTRSKPQQVAQLGERSGTKNSQP